MSFPRSEWDIHVDGSASKHLTGNSFIKKVSETELQTSRDQDQKEAAYFRTIVANTATVTPFERLGPFPGRQNVRWGVLRFDCMRGNNHTHQFESHHRYR